jgi:hypothetical protein
MTDLVLMGLLTALGFALGRLQGARTDLASGEAKSPPEAEPSRPDKAQICALLLSPPPEPEPSRPETRGSIDPLTPPTDEISSARAAAWSRILCENPRAREDLALLARRHPRQARLLRRAALNMEKWSAGVDSNALARIAHWERLMRSLRRKAQ